MMNIDGLRVFPELHRALRLKAAYDGLKIEARPRFVFEGRDRHIYRIPYPHKRTASRFYMGWQGRAVPIFAGGAPEDYYLREDGTAANLGAATGPGTSQADCASIATFNAGAVAGGDIAYLCEDGGIFRSQIIVPG